jgi:hypothetical protein
MRTPFNSERMTVKHKKSELKIDSRFAEGAAKYLANEQWAKPISNEDNKEKSNECDQTPIGHSGNIPDS